MLLICFVIFYCARQQKSHEQLLEKNNAICALHLKQTKAINEPAY